MILSPMFNLEVYQHFVPTLEKRTRQIFGGLLNQKILIKLFDIYNHLVYTRPWLFRKLTSRSQYPRDIFYHCSNFPTPQE